MSMRSLAFFRKTIACAACCAWFLLGLACAGWAGISSAGMPAGPAGEELPQFGGPGSVGGTLNRDSEAEPAVALERGPLDGWFAFKERLNRDHGFAFGLDYNALWQGASQSPGRNQAAGGALRIFGQWTLLGRGSEDVGFLVYKVENRHRLGASIAPKALGFETGYTGLTAVPFSDIGWALTNLYWDQRFLGNRLAFAVGVVDVTDYVDVYGLVDSWTAFSNLAFTTNPTIPAPNQGLGLACRVLAANNIYLLGGMADANGDPSEPGDFFRSLVDEAEYFSHLEIGWVSSFANRFSDNIHLTAWHVDQRQKAGTPSGWGLAFSISRLLAQRWEPFLRMGYAKDGGALWERSLSLGLGWHARERGDLIGVGLNWSRPSADTLGPGLGDQYTAEIFYRVQVLKLLTVTPGVQLLLDPAQNPEEDLIAILGVRARVSF